MLFFFFSNTMDIVLFYDNLIKMYKLKVPITNH